MSGGAIGQAGRMADRTPSLWRALRMRCPVCGHKPITTGYGELVETCPECRTDYAAGEEGYYVGALIVNMAVCLLSFFAAFAIGLAVTWPDVPWTGLTYGLLAVMVVVPIWFYPRSKTVWVWLDLRLHKDVLSR